MKNYIKLRKCNLFYNFPATKLASETARSQSIAFDKCVAKLIFTVYCTSNYLKCVKSFNVVVTSNFIVCRAFDGYRTVNNYNGFM